MGQEKSLASPIAVRPTGRGAWSFAGFGKLDEIVAGGVGHRVVVSELRDSGTAAAMIAYVAEVLNQAGVRNGRVVLREEDGVAWTARGKGADVVARAFLDGEEPEKISGDYRPIAGGSDADYGVLGVGGPEMAPKPPRRLGAPRRSRGTPRLPARTGPRNGPPTPKRSSRPGKAGALLVNPASLVG
jgi:hypothetical protein